jgi:hypothetical protein
MHIQSVNSHPQSGRLKFSCCGNCRWQQKTEALLCFDVELAVARGLGKNHHAPSRFYLVLNVKTVSCRLPATTDPKRGIDQARSPVLRGKAAQPNDSNDQHDPYPTQAR